MSPEDKTACGNVTAGGDRGAFAENALALVGNLSSAAPENDGFFVGAVEKGDSRVYGLAQCWENVNKSSCRLCLKAAAKAVSSCVPMAEGRAMNSGCYMRYSTTKFYNNSAGDAAADSENSEFSPDYFTVISRFPCFSIKNCPSPVQSRNPGLIVRIIRHI